MMHALAEAAASNATPTCLGRPCKLEVTAPFRYAFAVNTGMCLGFQQANMLHYCPAIDVASDVASVNDSWDSFQFTALLAPIYQKSPAISLVLVS